MLGRGEFCAVFEMVEPDRVLKLTTDPAHVAYLVDGLSPSGIHRPILFATHGKVGETKRGLPLYLVEVEKLYPIKRGSPNARLVRKITRYVEACKRFPEQDDELADMPSELSGFMCRLNWFWMNYKCQPDAKHSNFMQRADGTLVFNDPVFNQDLYRRYG